MVLWRGHNILQSQPIDHTTMADSAHVVRMRISQEGPAMTRHVIVVLAFGINCSVTAMATAGAQGHSSELGVEHTAVFEMYPWWNQLYAKVPDDNGNTRIADAKVILRVRFFLSGGITIQQDAVVVAGGRLHLYATVAPGSLNGLVLVGGKLIVSPFTVANPAEAQNACAGYRDQYPDGFAELFDGRFGQCVRYVLAGNKLEPPDPDGDGSRFESDYCPNYAGPIESKGCPRVVRAGIDDPALPDTALVCSEQAVNTNAGLFVSSPYNFRVGCGDLGESQPELYGAIANAIYLIDDPNLLNIVRNAWVPAFLREVLFP